MRAFLKSQSSQLLNVVGILAPADVARSLPALLCADWFGFRENHAAWLLELWRQYLLRSGFAVQFDFMRDSAVQELIALNRAYGALHRIKSISESAANDPLITFKERRMFDSFVHSMENVSSITPNDHELFMVGIRIPLIPGSMDGEEHEVVIPTKDGGMVNLTLEYGTGEFDDLVHTMFVSAHPRLFADRHCPLGGIGPHGRYEVLSHKEFFLLMDDIVEDPHKAWENRGSSGCRMVASSRSTIVFGGGGLGGLIRHPLLGIAMSGGGGSGFLVGAEVDAWLNSKRDAAPELFSTNQAEVGSLLVIVALKFLERGLIGHPTCPCHEGEQITLVLERDNVVTYVPPHETRCE